MMPLSIVSNRRWTVCCSVRSVVNSTGQTTFAAMSER